ncbi:MAG: glycosyltransferase family 4 protein [Actinomycetes bacterium]
MANRIRNPARICLISTELFGRGSYAGFGRATRTIGLELVRRGYDVSAVVAVRRGMTPESYDLDGIKVHEFLPQEPSVVLELCRTIDADIYHSQDPSYGTYLARKAMPDRVHIVTFRDPMTWRDWLIEAKASDTRSLRWLLWPAYVENPFVRRAIRRSTGLYGASELATGKARAKYRIGAEFLPTPVHVPDHVVKAEQPTVCWVGRFDRRKRPEEFFELARAFPDVRFIAVGSTVDIERDRMLRELAAPIPNLELTGTIDQFESGKLAEIYAQSWVLISTSLREGLPNVFLEAAANRCAILSTVDPDGFATRFGYLARHDGLEAGLRKLLTDDAWRAAGERGYQWVSEVFGMEPALERHIAVYEELLASKR